MHPGNVRNRPKIPEAIAGRGDLDLGIAFEETLYDGVAACRVSQAQAADQEENPRGRHYTRCNRTANENGHTGRIMATRQPDRGAAPANHARSNM